MTYEESEQLREWFEEVEDIPWDDPNYPSFDKLDDDKKLFPNSDMSAVSTFF